MKVKYQRIEEGGYVETVDGLIFEVRGSIHPADRIIAFIAYVPDQSGDRIRGSSRFRRIHDFLERYEFLQNAYPEYLYLDPLHQRIIQAVPREKVKKIYCPREKMRTLVEIRPDRGIEATAVNFAMAIAKNSGVSPANIGVSGSILVDLYTKESDIDLVIYGEENGHKVYETLEKLRKEGWISPYDDRSVERVCNFRWGKSGLQMKRMIEFEKAKILHGKVENTYFFIKLVRDWGIDLVANRYVPLGTAVVRAEVIDDRDSIFTPCRYGVDGCEFLEGKIDGKLMEICSFMAKFAEMARAGDRVEARGKVEKVETREGEYMRLLLESDRDYLIKVD